MPLLATFASALTAPTFANALVLMYGGHPRAGTPHRRLGLAGPQPTSKRGPNPLKGVHLRSLAAMFTDPMTLWRQAQVDWYGGQKKPVGYRTGECLWYTQGHNPVPVRFVRVRYEETHKRTGKVSVKAAAFFCSDIGDTTMTPERTIGLYVGRWPIRSDPPSPAQW